ncbi:MAG TPA: serine/threonine-protein kinase [Methylibium sp.]|uniref:serine/threonine-protein kinase n=1 Tax=Methylibium sp. TaxID=2067992 RepID=UPI002DBAE127|nr:serine/threonine-protein kinase [Methylibium sp.]HEU4458877.1 serine/threonine-protein kinase [Methylibium sp.]
MLDAASPTTLWIVLVVGVAVVAGLVLMRRAGAAGPHERRGGKLLKTDFASTQQNAAVDTVLDPRVAEPQRRIGHYVIERDIGRGAMGMVLLCRDERTGEAVAVKTMALGREFHGDALEEARERFFREAEMAGRLRHPDIVAIREAGEDGGTAYIAMELLSGRDLSEFAQPTRLLPTPVVLGIVARVALALAHAHRQGVTHRDIKPANIMVELISGMVKVTDFGIARIIDSTQTRTGLVLGTPSFMSPEQMAGERVDGRSDLYALGVTLFQLLTGQLPHKAESMAELLHSIANDAAPDIRTLRPELPEALANVVAIALEKHPDRRYADGDSFASDLQAVVAQMKAPAASAGGAGQNPAPQSQRA